MFILKFKFNTPHSIVGHVHNIETKETKHLCWITQRGQLAWCMHMAQQMDQVGQHSETTRQCLLTRCEETSNNLPHLTHKLASTKKVAGLLFLGGIKTP